MKQDITTIQVLNIITRPTNYKLMCLLPSDIKTLEAKLKINKINTNAHVNELERATLIKRYRGTGRVEISELGTMFLDLIDTCHMKRGTP